MWLADGVGSHLVQRGKLHDGNKNIILFQLVGGNFSACRAGPHHLLGSADVIASRAAVDLRVQDHLAPLSSSSVSSAAGRATTSTALIATSSPNSCSWARSAR